MDAYDLFDKIGNLEINGIKIKDNFNYDDLNFWNSLRTSFRLYYDDLNKTNRKSHIYTFKYFVEKNLFEFNKNLVKTDIIFFNTVYGRYDKKNYSPFYKNVINNMGNKNVEVSYINFPSFFNLKTYYSFDYEKRFPFQMFIDNTEEKNLYVKYLNLYNQIISSEEFIKFLLNKNDVKILNSLKYVFGVGICESIRCYLGHKKMLEKFKPKILVFCDFLTYQTYSGILAAKKYNVKTIIITHGIPAIYFNFPTDIIFPDKICTFGQKDYGIYLKAGIPKQNLEICGDARVNEKPLKQKITKKNYKKLLWLTTGISNEHSKKLSKIIFNFVKKHKLELTIKMHPDDSFYLNYKKESIFSNVNCKIIKKSNLLKHIKENDFIICNESTALVDVIANYKPIIFENILKKDNLIFDYFDNSCFYDYDTLEKSFNYIKTNKAEEYYIMIRNKMLNDFSYDYGNSSKKISKIIKEMLKSK